jgi:hypothetical protein
MKVLASLASMWVWSFNDSWGRTRCMEWVWSAQPMFICRHCIQWLQALHAMVASVVATWAPRIIS